MQSLAINKSSNNSIRREGKHAARTRSLSAFVAQRSVKNTTGAARAAYANHHDGPHGKAAPVVEVPRCVIQAEPVIDRTMSNASARSNPSIDDPRCEGRFDKPPVADQPPLL